MCLLNEQTIRKQNIQQQHQSQLDLNKNLNSLKVNQKKRDLREEICNSYANDINIGLKKYENKSSKQSSSYTFSFSEQVSIVGNQIQIESSSSANPIDNNLTEMSVNLPPILNNNSFKLKFSEKDLKE